MPTTTRHLTNYLLYLLPLVTVLSVTMAEQTSPVPLRTPSIRTPDQSTGSGLAPEVTVHVRVLASGKVGDVNVKRITPASDYDAIFEKEVQETLKRWRYAPATLDGEPIDAELSWTIQFPARYDNTTQTTDQVSMSEEPDTSDPYPWRRYGQAVEQAQDLRERILTLPPELRMAYLNRIAGVADSFLNSSERHKASDGRVLAFADGDNSGLAAVLANNVEATFGVLDKLFGVELGTHPERYRVVAFLYSHESDFARLRKAVECPEFAAGFYNPGGLLAFHREMSSSTALIGTMLHESTHAYLDRYISRPGVSIPTWLNEGLAEYIGNSKIKKKELVPGKTQWSAVYRGPWGMVSDRSGASLQLTDVKGHVRRGEALTMRELIEADHTIFYGDKHELFYPMSWLLVHYLRHGEEGWDTDKFSRLLLYVAEGYPAPDVLETVYGDLDKLGAGYERYVRKF